MEYKVNIQGLPGVNLYADKPSADKLVACVAPAAEAAPFIKGEKATFSNKLVEVTEVRKTIAKKSTKKWKNSFTKKAPKKKVAPKKATAKRKK